MVIIMLRFWSAISHFIFNTKERTELRTLSKFVKRETYIKIFFFDYFWGLGQVGSILKKPVKNKLGGEKLNWISSHVQQFCFQGSSKFFNSLKINFNSHDQISYWEFQIQSDFDFVNLDLVKFGFCEPITLLRIKIHTNPCILFLI